MMKKRLSKQARRRQHGVSILESMISIVVLSLVFFGLFQIFHWGMARLFCSYASFYAAKAQSLGYAKRTIDKAARVAAIGISGADESDPALFSGGFSLGERLAMYMSTGNSNLNFRYWDPVEYGTPELLTHIRNYGHPGASDTTHADVELRNATMLHDNLAYFFQIGTSDISPSAETEMFNHAKYYLGD